MLKKYLVVLFLIFMSVTYIMPDQIENIVLLDTSVSMLPFYSGTIEYLIDVGLILAILQSPE